MIRYLVGWWKYRRPRPFSHVRWAWQRVFRGWDDRALWSVDLWIARILGEQLIGLSKNTVSYPDKNEWRPEGFDSLEQWQWELYSNGAKLVLYSATDDLVDVDPDTREAMQWVTDWFGYLWD